MFMKKRTLDESTGVSNLPITNMQAAELLDVSSRTLRRWQKLYNLPAHKIGRRIYYFESEIMEFVKSKKGTSTMETCEK